VHYGLVYMLGCLSGALISFMAFAIVSVGRQAETHRIGPARMRVGLQPGRAVPPRGRAGLGCGNE
jgi:hypothetical protein